MSDLMESDEEEIRVRRPRVLLSSDDEGPDSTRNSLLPVNTEEGDKEESTRNSVPTNNNDVPLNVSVDANECDDRNKGYRFMSKLLTEDDVGDESDSKEVMSPGNASENDEGDKVSAPFSNKGNINNDSSGGNESDENGKEQPKKSHISSTKEKKKKRPKPKKNEDEKLKIRSETQRLVRESAVALPYHRAKQRTLREFLSRRQTTNISADALRSTSCKMIDTWKKIDESIKEAIEFFKSESEEELEEDIAELKTEASVHVLVENACNEEITPNEVEETLNELPKNSEQIILTNETANETPAYPEVGQILSNEDHVKRDGCSRELITNLTLIQEEEIIDHSEKAGEKTPNPIDKTSKWLEDITNYEKREAIKKRLELSPKTLDIVPELTADVDDLIEFSEPVKSSLKHGARQLMERLFKNHQPNQETQSEMSTVVTTAVRDDSGEIKEISVEKIIINSTTADAVDDSKPGSRRQLLRGKLLNDIEIRWKEEYEKRCAEFSEITKPDYEDKVSGDEADDEDEEEEIVESTESESEPEEDDIRMSDQPRKTCAFGDSEAEESSVGEDLNADQEYVDEDVESNNGVESTQNSGEKTDADNESQDEERADGELTELDESLLPAFQPGGGLLLGGSTLTQETQKLPVRSLSPTSSPMVATPAIAAFRLPISMSDAGENDLSASSARKILFGAEAADKSFLLHNRSITEEMDDPFQFVSGVFPETPAVVPPQQDDQELRRSRIILAEDSGESNDVADANNEYKNQDDVSNGISPEKSVKEDALTFKKKRKNLTFSDDEDGDDEVGEAEENYPVSEESEVEAENGPVEYDSEENEIMPVKPSEFFENEAELSESEWSGDEDEQGLDKLDAEEGDADVLDEEQVASQLGKIHMRRMLDQDARDVRLLQEILLEDGDLHSDGKGRQRKFRWKNLTGFDMTDDRQQLPKEIETDVEEDGELAKRRHDKAQLLQELQKQGKDLLDDELMSPDALLQVGRRLMLKMHHKPIASTDEAVSTELPRSSLLSRDSEFLSRLTRGASSAESLLGPTNSKNFVFATKSPEKIPKDDGTSTKSCKRKAMSCQNESKRVRLLPLLDSRPSILDNLH